MVSSANAYCSLVNKFVLPLIKFHNQYEYINTVSRDKTAASEANCKGGGARLVRNFDKQKKGEVCLTYAKCK